ncbi:MAG: hypothetical protein Q8O32_02985, partial [bacterium]|nr:hypothetical protein [bacterium]
MKKRQQQQRSSFLGWGGIVLLVFMIIFGTIQIAGVDLTTDKVKIPRVSTSVTQTAGHNNSSSSLRPKQPLKDGEVGNDEEIQVPIWKDLIATLSALGAGGIFWRKKRWSSGAFGAGTLGLVYTLFRDNFSGENWSPFEIVKFVLVVLVSSWAFWRLNQAQKDGQWLATIDPKTREVNNQYKVLLFEKQQIPFVLFHIILILGIIFSETMFRTNLWLTVIIIFPWLLLSLLLGAEEKKIYFWGRTALSGMLFLIMLSLWGTLLLLLMVGLFLLSSYIKLEPAQKLVWEWKGKDVYDPRYYFWQKEDGEDT